MSRKSYAALLLAIGLIVQIPLLYLAIGLSLIYQPAGNILGLFLSPGVALFWGEGIHSSNPLSGLLVAILFNTAYFFLILLLCSTAYRKLKQI